MPSKLDPYKAIIDERLAAYPKLSATRLYWEVWESGYAGSCSQVKRYVRGFVLVPSRSRSRSSGSRRRRAIRARSTFADLVLPWGRRYALAVVLGYLRMLWLRYYERQTMETVVRGLEGAFAFFGGVPAKLLFDQMRAVRCWRIGVPAVQRALGPPHPGVQGRSGENEGEGRASAFTAR